MKIYAEVLPTDLGRVMYRINAALKRYAPSWATFVSRVEDADLQILDVIGDGSFKFLKCSNYILLQHCLLSGNVGKDYYIPYFRNAKLVSSYMDLYRILGVNDFRFIRLPWGVDPEVFHKLEPEEYRLYSVLTTGHVAATESIDEVYRAVEKTGGYVVHVGHNFELGRNFKHFEDITDESLVKLYNQTRYVSGLRKMEGLELPVIEGLLCGARGICYDKDHYRYWYGDLVEYVTEDAEAEMGLYSPNTMQQVLKILESPLRPVTDQEIELVKHLFSWENIFMKFWKEVELIV